MRKRILVSLAFIAALLLFSGCNSEKQNVENNNETQFSINDFKEGILENYDSKIDLKVESRYSMN